MRRPHPTRPRLSRACACDPVRVRSVKTDPHGPLSRQSAAAPSTPNSGLAACSPGSPAAPAAVESGKHKNAKFGWACNKRLRKAFGVLAQSSTRSQSSTRWNARAADRYANTSPRP